MDGCGLVGQCAAQLGFSWNLFSSKAPNGWLWFIHAPGIFSRAPSRNLRRGTLEAKWETIGNYGDRNRSSYYKGRLPYDSVDSIARAIDTG